MREEKIEDLLKLVKSANERYPWTPFSEILRQNGIPKSRGSNATELKISKIDVYTPELMGGYINTKSKYKDFLKVGRKQTFFYKISEDTYFDAVCNFFENLTFKNNRFSENYPISVFGDELADIPAMRYFISDIQKNDDFINVTFCMNRIKQNKKEFDKNDLDQRFDNFFGSYSRVVGIKDEPSQNFDVLYIHKKRRVIELRVDISQNTVMKAPKILIELQKYIISLNIELFQLRLFNEIIPLNPLFIKLEKEEQNGYLVNIGYSNTDDDFDRSTLNFKSKIDIRKTKIHEKSKEAVERIDLYRVATKWDFDDGHSIVLFIPGMKKHIETPINTAFFMDCFSRTDYNFVLGKIFKYLCIDEK